MDRIHQLNSGRECPQVSNECSVIYSDLQGIYSNLTFRTKTPVPEARHHRVRRLAEPTTPTKPLLETKVKICSQTLHLEATTLDIFRCSSCSRIRQSSKARPYHLRTRQHFLCTEKELIAQNVVEFQSRVSLQSENSSKVGIKSFQWR